MFDVWANLGELIPVSASLAGGNVASGERRFSPGDTATISVSGAPDTGILVEIKKDGQIIQPAGWEGKRTDSAGLASWSFVVPTETGLYQYRIIIPQIGETVDAANAVSFRVGAQSVIDDNATTSAETGGDAILEEGGGFFSTPINVMGISVSPLLLAAAIGGIFLLSKGRR